MKSEANNHTEMVDHDEISFFDGRIAHRGSFVCVPRWSRLLATD
ncbi:MAG: hypothetical protein JMDDDDMK_05499 [Acidobacteria bacterium]|nr:hypothetical protein [Acidobacteriota bacterium]